MSTPSLTTGRRTTLALCGGLAVVAAIVWSLLDGGSDSVRADRTDSGDEVTASSDQPSIGQDDDQAVADKQAKTLDLDRENAAEATDGGARTIDETTGDNDGSTAVGDDSESHSTDSGTEADIETDAETDAGSGTQADTAPSSTPSPTRTTTQVDNGGSRISSEIGFSPGGWFPDEPDDRLKEDLDRMIDVGATWLRIDFDWSEIERTRGEYHWHRTDRVIAEANRRGLRVLALLGNSPGWSRTGGSAKSPPDDSADFAKFAADAVDRYTDQGVEAWELWNEPNLSRFWDPRPNPERYAELAIETMAAMRATDPSITIIAGGLAPAADTDTGNELSPETFLVRTLDAGAGSFDAFAIHPYSYPALPIDAASSEWNPFHNLPRFHEILGNRGHGKKQIWLTEYGAPTGTADRAVSESHQARSVTEAIEAVEGWAWAGPLLFYAHRDQRSAPSDLESNFGLLTSDGRPKQAWRDLVALTAD